MPQRFKPSTSSESNDLRNAGLKVTLPRLKILDILADGSARHMSAEDIYKKLLVSNEDVGLATVYRVLTQFEAAGLVTRHHFEGGMAVFELNQGAHHDHIVCVDCGRVEEFMDGGIEGCDHTLFTPIGEIDDDVGLGADAGHDLDVQHHFAFRTIPTISRSPIGADGFHLWRLRYVGQAAEFLQIIGEISATEL